MEILDKYVSNTLAANGNQTWMTNENPSLALCGMVFIKVYKGGRFPYVFGYSGIIDSTFGDGSISHCNSVCPPWKIVSLSYTITDTPEPSEAENKEFTLLTFSGNISATVDGEKIIHTDPVKISAEKGQFICLKTTFSGEKVPCHEESIIALYRRNENGEWILSPKIPLPVFTGVEREVKKKFAFIGDSITQGIGTDFNSYRHYASKVAEIIGDEYGYWDLGIGYARGADAATDGIWLEKAKHNDIITVCFGVNDMFNGRTVGQIISDLEKITDSLKSAGLKVIIQTVPPFDYDEHYEKIWNEVNTFIRNELSKKADGFLDDVKFLCADGKNSPKSKYGSHPNDEGNAVWAEELAGVIKSII